MSVRAAVLFPIHNENEGSFQRNGLKQKDSCTGSDSFVTGNPASIVKPTLAPKSSRKALSTLNNNVLNSRAHAIGSKPSDGKSAHVSFGKQFAFEKKPKVQVVSVGTTIPTTTLDSFLIPPVTLLLRSFLNSFFIGVLMCRTKN